MEDIRFSKVAAKVISTALDKVLKVEANTTSCFFMYQPKPPKELQKFRRDQ